MPNENKNAPEEMKFKAFKLVEPSISETGVIKAFVSVFGTPDAYDEIIDPGAFKESLAVKFPKGVWCHHWDEPIAVTMQVEEIYAGDARLPAEIMKQGGLYIEGQLIKGVQRADETYLLMKAKGGDGRPAIDEFSIGYFLTASYQGEDGYLHLKTIDLKEWSPVLIGAHPDTVLIDIKSGQEVENNLTDKNKSANNQTESAVKLLSKEKKDTIRLAIRALTDALNTGAEADKQDGKNPLKQGGIKKIPVAIINKCVRELLKMK
jgi:HK97 family phage prohead protease